MNFSLNKRVVIYLVFTVFALVTITYSVYKSGTYVVYFNGSTKMLPIYSVERNDNKISISFDCAYGAEYTDKILDVLNEYNVKCTFFAVEFWVKKYPEKVKKIIDEGHEIGTHSKTHPNMSKLSIEEIENELTSSINAIKEVANCEVTLFRAPFGDYNNKVINTAKKLNLYTIQWDVDSIDWKDISAKQITDRIVKKTKSGSIILCHNNGLHTLEALPYVLSNLQAKGFEFVKISQLIYKENYTIDSFGRQKLINNTNI